jgi:hypothetical protein
MQDFLKREKKYLMVFISSTKELRPDIWKNEAFLSDLLYLFIAKAMEEIHNEGLNLSSELLKEIHGLLVGTFRSKIAFPSDEDASVKGILASFQRAVKEISGDLTGTIRQKGNESMAELIPMFNRIVDDCIRNNPGKVNGISIIVDDLDKYIRNDKAIYEILSTYEAQMRQLNCCIITTIPPSFFYNSKLKDLHNQLRQSYCRIYYLPPFQVDDKDWGDNVDQIKLMVDIVKEKIAKSIIPSNNLANPLPENVMKKAARLSGGLTPEFIRMLKDCCSQADRIPAEQLEEERLIEFLKDYFNEELVVHYDSILSDEHKKILRDVFDDHKKKDNEFFEKLLEYAAIIEYVNEAGERWYDIHPAVAPIILESNHRIITSLLD